MGQYCGKCNCNFFPGEADSELHINGEYPPFAYAPSGIDWDNKENVGFTQPPLGKRELTPKAAIPNRAIPQPSDPEQGTYQEQCNIIEECYQNSSSMERTSDQKNITLYQNKSKSTGVGVGTSSRYFTPEESRETISQRPMTTTTPREKPTHSYKSGATYTGQWIGGFRYGYGEQLWVDGAKYQGEWMYNHAHGKGTFFHVDGDVYEGRWAYDKANGYGIYRHTNGATYEGHWKNDLQHGKGMETWSDSSNYNGDYHSSRKQGFGTYVWADGSKYIGHWFDNKISGHGTYMWEDGRKYEGAWKDNNMHGFGEYYWPDGRTYEGEYLNDKKHGYGYYYWPDGRRYEGWWYEGKQFGLGKYIVPEESMKYGLWENGKRIVWFNEEEISQVINNTLDFRQFFKNKSSKVLMKKEMQFDEIKKIQTPRDRNNEFEGNTGFGGQTGMIGYTSGLSARKTADYLHNEHEPIIEVDEEDY